MTDRQRQAVDLLIDGADVVCLDGPGTVVPDGAIAIAGNRIHWIGPSSDARRLFDAGSTVDGSGRIAMPGLIDTHVHTAQHLLRGKIAEIARRERVKIPIWKNYYIPFEAMLDPDDVHLSALACYANMITVGTTCFAEAGGPHPEEMGRAALEIGIRGFLARSTIDQGEAFPDAMRSSTDRALRANVDLVRQWAGQDRVRAWLSLRQIITCSPPLIRSTIEAARELGTRIHVHLCEGSYEIDYTMERFGKRPAEYVESIGGLGDFLHTAHSTLVSPGELDLYAERDCSVGHCPFNNYHVGPHPLLRMWRRGIRVGLGTDGAASWGSLDIFRAAHAARIGQQAVAGTPLHFHDIMPSEELIRVATNGGAAALGLEAEIGSLEVGKKADILIVECGELDQVPRYDPLFAVAAMTVGRDVRTAVIDGEVVMKDRELLTIDRDRLARELQSRLPDIMERFRSVAN
ncbi:MAG: amidohydrolase family protein [Defluviicoccus sp.]|nr:amidohydrolase family protein [Defluviicoccus sp.]MDE0384597.1 amidohydrolase family protein [Defluviicoccus sp.]